MRLDDLRRQRLLIPEEHWGDQPAAPGDQRASALLIAGLTVAALGLVWFGGGSISTFLGLGLFAVDLVLFLAIGFASVDRQVHWLLNLGLGGQVEGLEPEPSND